jgi:hypothetical protein
MIANNNDKCEWLSKSQTGSGPKPWHVLERYPISLPAVNLLSSDYGDPIIRMVGRLNFIRSSESLNNDLKMVLIYLLITFLMYELIRSASQNPEPSRKGTMCCSRPDDMLMSIVWPISRLFVFLETHHPLSTIVFIFCIPNVHIGLHISNLAKKSPEILLTTTDQA